MACDIAIESMLIDLLGDAFPSNMDGRAKRALRILRAQVGGVVTAERLYHLFSNEGNMVDLRSLAPIFFHDTHGLWYGPEEEWDARRGSTGAQKRETRDSGDSPGATPDVVGSTRLDEVLEDAPTSADAGGQGDSDSRDEADSSELDQPELDDARDESAFDQDVFDSLNMIACVEKRNIPGAPAPAVGTVRAAVPWGSPYTRMNRSAPVSASTACAVSPRALRRQGRKMDGAARRRRNAADHTL